MLGGLLVLNKITQESTTQETHYKLLRLDKHPKMGSG